MKQPCMCMCSLSVVVAPDLSYSSLSHTTSLPSVTIVWCIIQREYKDRVPITVPENGTLADLRKAAAQHVCEYVRECVYQ